MKPEDIKNSISSIEPDAYMKTRIFAGISEAGPKKRSKKKIAVAVISGILSLAVLITGLGIGLISQKKESVNEFGVLVAYASTGEFLDIGSVNEQELFYSIHFAPYSDNEAVEEAREKYIADRDEVENKMSKLGKEGYTASLNAGDDIFCNDAGERTAEFFHVAAGQFALSFDDYSNVENFKVENSGKYGQLSFDYDFLGRLGHKDTLPTDFDDEFLEYVVNNYPYPYYGHRFEVSGEVLRRSQESGFYSILAGRYEVNYGYTLLWEISDELKRAIGNDLDFDLSNIKDTITFTVEFTDGMVKTASVALYFDSDGYMHFGEN